MSDDFDDLYNVYNGNGKEYTYNDEDLYGDEGLDVNEDVANTKFDNAENDLVDNEKPKEKQSRQPNKNAYQQQQQQQQQQPQQQQQMGMYSPAMYQQYLAFQNNFQQQMMMNPYQMQQMMQNQYGQNSNSYQKQGPKKESRDKEPTETESSTEDGGGDEGKMFIGGLSWETTDESLRQYFSQFGEVVDCSIMRDPATQNSRGFGFLTMKDKAAVDRILNRETHMVDGKKIDPKRAISRDEQEKSEKIFVGGISPEVTEDDFRKYFTQFGNVIDATLVLERDTGKPRGFGFITFESNEGVEQVLKNASNLSIKDKAVEVRRAMNKGKQTRQQVNVPAFNMMPNFQPYMANGLIPGGMNLNYLNMYPNMMNNYQMAAMYNNQRNPNYQQQNDMYNTQSKKPSHGNKETTTGKHSSSSRHHRQDNTRGSSSSRRDHHSNEDNRGRSHYRPY